ncbi:DUF973 family protein [Sulfurisphaera tokodaii]|uniref:DUF973 family protein n=2 Tax=Sulfurisphaera tokodaii TaxID=111955 RepID=Q970D5_SULTO|nr:DUF973 family protein [Sulfurisphaera tokodaii]BAB66738.1 hypothetical protein STK_16570 [Sulfurisphaera tokodaii str. 7]HII73188.1 DUF973 family protein [Sulfurisphaera tokodaii]
MSSSAIKYLSLGMLIIILSLPLAVIIWYISLLFGITPPMNVTINGFLLSIFSPMILSGAFLGIINMASFYRIRIGLRVLNLDHNTTLGALLNVIASIFLFTGNLLVLLSALVSVINIITILAWISAEILTLIFYISGNIFLGIGLMRLGELMKNSTLKNGGMLITSVVLSYFGYIIAYLGLRKISSQQIAHYFPLMSNIRAPSTKNVLSSKIKTQGNEELTITHPIYYKETVKVHRLQSQETRSVQQQPYQTQKIPSPQPTKQVLPSTLSQSYTPTSMPQSQTTFVINGNGILKSDGTVYLNIYVSQPCVISSVKIENLPYSPLSIQPQSLQIGNNQVLIKFDKVALLGLLKGKEYKLYLTLRTYNIYYPDQVIKIKYETT